MPAEVPCEKQLGWDDNRNGLPRWDGTSRPVGGGRERLPDSVQLLVCARSADAHRLKNRPPRHPAATPAPQSISYQKARSARAAVWPISK